MKKNISIIGMGYLGGSLGLALKKNFSGTVVTGIDKGSILIRAENVGAIDKGCIYTEMEEGLKGADVVFVVAPITTTIDIIPKIAAAVDERAVVSDTAFTKVQIMQTAQRYFTKGAVFIGGHPIVGYEKGEIEEADPYIFAGRTYALTPPEGCRAASLETLQNLVSGIGSRVVTGTPEEHDEIFGRINQLLQLIAMAHVNTVFSGIEGRKRDMTLAYSEERFRRFVQELLTPYYVWDEIFSSNHGLLKRHVDDFIRELRRITGTVGTDRFVSEYEKMSDYLRDVPFNAKGFEGDLFHLFITIKDEPGAIARLVSFLAEGKFEIRDIELVKIKEGEAGTLRVSFSSQNIASRAGRFLVKSGYGCRTQYEYKDFYY
jgi:prephenate dehydrogenase